MANNVVFKTELLKGATGDRGEAGVAESVPTDGVILTTSETVPQGYEEIDVGDIFTELEAEIEERAKEDIVTDAYDATHTYNSGDYAIYNDTLYKCNTDNTTGAFNGNYWDAVTVMGEIADAQDDITTLNNTLARKPELVTMHVDTTTTYSGAIGIAVSYTGYIYVSSLLTVGYPGYVERRDTNYLTVYNNDSTVKANEAVVFDAYFLKV